MEKVENTSKDSQVTTDLGKLLLSEDSANVIASFEKDALGT